MKKDSTSPVAIFDYSKFYTGTIWKNSKGSLMKIINYKDKFHVTVQFLDSTNYITIANIDNIKKGNVKNPYELNIYGGYIGEGIFNSSLEYIKIYKTWYDMLCRVSIYSKDKSYKNVSVSNDWLNYQNFATWYINYINLLNPEFYNDYQLDKDILQWNDEYKIYSSETCCLIPSRLNIALVGLHVKRNNHPDLPLGVMPNNNKFSSYVVNGKIREYLGSFDNPMDAFEKYRSRKLELLKELALYYYNIKAIQKNIFEIIYNIDIKPF